MESIAKQLSKINLRKAKLTTGETVEQMMANLASELYNKIQHYIDKWYNEYYPKIYDRVSYYKKALYAEDIAHISVKGDKLIIGLGFYKEYAWQTSLPYFEYTDDYGNHSYIPSRDVHLSYVPVLMEYGWHSKRLERYLHKSIEYFTYFDGIHAVEYGIRDFYREHPLMYGKVINHMWLLNYRIF